MRKFSNPELGPLISYAEWLAKIAMNKDNSGGARRAAAVSLLRFVQKARAA